MKSSGVIEPSSSPWSSPVVLVKKKDGSTSFCVDYRKLNDVTKKDSYPLPKIDDTLARTKWFSMLDLQSGYWQVEIADKEKTAFSTNGGYASLRLCHLDSGMLRPHSSGLWTALLFYNYYSS